MLMHRRRSYTWGLPNPPLFFFPLRAFELGKTRAAASIQKKRFLLPPLFMTLLRSARRFYFARSLAPLDHYFGTPSFFFSPSSSSFLLPIFFLSPAGSNPRLRFLFSLYPKSVSPFSRCFSPCNGNIMRWLFLFLRITKNWFYEDFFFCFFVECLGKIFFGRARKFKGSERFSNQFKD